MSWNTRVLNPLGITARPVGGTDACPVQIRKLTCHKTSKVRLTTRELDEDRLYELMLEEIRPSQLVPGEYFV